MFCNKHWKIGSDPRYMICVTLFCTLRESENTQTCENCTRFKNVLQNLILRATAYWKSHIFEFKIFKFWKCKDIIQTHKVQHCSMTMCDRTKMESLGCFQRCQILALFLWEYVLCQALHWIVRLQPQAHSEVLHFSSCHWSWTNTNLKDAAMNHNNNVKHLYHSLWLCPMAKNDMHFPWLEPEQVFS